MLDRTRENMESLTKEEESFMDIAFGYAQQALAAQEVPVGCIFVYKNNVIAKGRNEVNRTKNATRHAELICIDQVNKFCETKNLNISNVLQEIQVFVTVEPCIMCAAALYDCKVKSVIFGCPNDRFGGQTVFDVSNFINHSTSIKGGYRAEEAMSLLKVFYKGTNPAAPSSKVKTKGKVNKQ